MALGARQPASNLPSKLFHMCSLLRCPLTASDNLAALGCSMKHHPAIHNSPHSAVGGHLKHADNSAALVQHEASPASNLFTFPVCCGPLNRIRTPSALALGCR
eukprot:gene12347-15524_t